MVEAVVGELGGLDILVNAAAIPGGHAPARAWRRSPTSSSGGTWTSRCWAICGALARRRRT